MFAFNPSVVELFRINPVIIGWFTIAHLLSIRYVLAALILMIYAKKKKIEVLPDKTGIITDSKSEWTKDIFITIALAAVSLVIFYSVQA